MEYKPNTNLEKLLFSTVKLQIEKGDGIKKVATGFFISYTIDENTGYLYLVTNKHVVKDIKHIKLIFNKRIDKNTVNLGEKLKCDFKNVGKVWYPHPDKNIDLVIFPFGEIITEMSQDPTLNGSPFLIPISDKIALNEKTFKLIYSIEEIVFIGYPQGQYDRFNNLPILRRGYTATPIIFNYNEMPIFLIDGSVFPGSSGSPVFVCNYGGYYLNNDIMMGPRTVLLGILSKAFKFNRDRFLIDLDFDYFNQKLNTDLGVVIKSNVIIELIKENLQKFEI